MIRFVEGTDSADRSVDAALARTHWESMMFTSIHSHRTRVRVQHADAVVAAGLAAALRANPEFEICNDLKATPSLVICDYSTGLRLAQSNRELGRPQAMTRLLVLTTQDREQVVRHALQSGVHGYLLTCTRVEELLDAVRAVAEGKSFVGLDLARRMADSITREALTAREAQVLNLLSAGHGNKVIACRLGIAVGTVKTHVNAIMTKLGVNSRTHAVSVAAQRGLVNLDFRVLH